MPKALVAATGLVLVLAVGCGNYAASASKIAHAQVDVAEKLRMESRLAYRLCQQTATYTYIQIRLGLLPVGRAGIGLPFSSWYAREGAARDAQGRAIPWAHYCQELDRTGILYPPRADC